MQPDRGTFVGILHGDADEDTDEDEDDGIDDTVHFDKPDQRQLDARGLLVRHQHGQHGQHSQHGQHDEYDLDHPRRDHPLDHDHAPVDHSSAAARDHGHDVHHHANAVVAAHLDAAVAHLPGDALEHAHAGDAVDDDVPSDDKDEDDYDGRLRGDDARRLSDDEHGHERVHPDGAHFVGQLRKKRGKKKDKQLGRGGPAPSIADRSNQ